MVNEKVELAGTSGVRTSSIKYFSYKIDYKINNNSFLMGPELSSFRTNLSYMPIMRGKTLSSKKEPGKFYLRVVVYPFLGGLLSLVPGYCLCIFIIYKKIIQNDYLSALPVFLLMLFLYISLIFFFNKRSKEYALLINDAIEYYCKKYLSDNQ